MKPITRAPDVAWRLAILVEESKHIGLADGVISLIEPLAELLPEWAAR